MKFVELYLDDWCFRWYLFEFLVFFMNSISLLGFFGFKYIRKLRVLVCCWIVWEGNGELVVLLLNFMIREVCLSKICVLFIIFLILFKRRIILVFSFLMIFFCRCFWIIIFFLMILDIFRVFIIFFLVLVILLFVVMIDFLRLERLVSCFWKYSVF